MKEYEYTDMADAAVSVHAMLTQVRDSFNNSVNELKKMEEICLFLKNCLGQKVPPIEIDASDENKLEKLDLNDERFAMKLANFLTKRDPIDRLNLVAKTIRRLLDGIEGLESKRAKASERVKLMPQFVEEEGVRRVNPEWSVSQRKLKGIVDTIQKYEIKLSFCYDKFFLQRKAVIGNVLGICETMYADIEKRGRGICERYFQNRFDIGSHTDGFKIADKQIRRTR